MHGGPINFKFAILPDASLRFASLLDADLHAADLTRADLVHARLDRANLKNAILRDAVLDHADFAGAQLSKAVLTGASLSHARNLTQEQIDETIGYASTTLPAHLQMPAEWLDVAPEVPSSRPIPLRALIAGVSACVIAGILLLGVARDEQPLEPPAVATKPQQLNRLPARPSLEVGDGFTATSNAEHVGAPDPQPNATETSVAVSPQGTKAIVGRSASLDETLMIPSGLRVEGVLGLNVHKAVATAQIELKSPVSAMASPGLTERWPSIDASTLAALRDAPANASRVTPFGAETPPPLPDRKPTVFQSPATSMVAIPGPVKPLPRATRRPRMIQQPIEVKPSSSAADVLAGGL
jgi:hypothetical protein